MYLIFENKINNNTFKYDINVYGGDEYSNGKLEHDPPHFHLNYNGEDVKILIPSVDEWEFYKNIKFNSGSCPTKIIKKIIIWLDLQSHLNISLSNIEYIRYIWNKLNKYNNLTTQIDKIYQHEASNIPNYKSVKEVKTLIIKEFRNFKIVLKGGLDYGKNKDSISKPHFYIEVNGGELRALIPTLDDWNKKHYIASGEVYDIFKGLAQVHDDIVNYFNNIDNLKYIQKQWNILNDKNKNVDKI